MAFRNRLGTPEAPGAFLLGRDWITLATSSMVISQRGPSFAGGWDGMSERSAGLGSGKNCARSRFTFPWNELTSLGGSGEDLGGKASIVEGSA